MRKLKILNSRNLKITVLFWITPRKNVAGRYHCLVKVYELKVNFMFPLKQLNLHIFKYSNARKENKTK